MKSKMGWIGPDGIYTTDAGYRDEGEKINLIVREDGRIERVCKHGVGHCIGHLTKWDKWMSVHGCDGCCTRYLEKRVDG